MTGNVLRGNQTSMQMKCIWVTSWENLFMPYAINKGPDPRSLISAFVVRCLDSIIPLVSISEISSLYLVSVTAQTGLSLPWLQTPKTGFLVKKLIFFLCDQLPQVRYAQII